MQSRLSHVAFLLVFSLLFVKQMSCSETPVRGTFIMLIRSDEKSVNETTRALSQLETAMNHRYHYPTNIFIESGFTDEWKAAIRASTSGEVFFHDVVLEVPSFLDLSSIPHQISAYDRNYNIPYRHMCRFYAGEFINHPGLADYDWVWRIDDNSQYPCQITYDPFRFMANHGYKYGYIHTLFEQPPVLKEGLWELTHKFMVENGIATSKMKAAENFYGMWDACHYWNNFEIVDMSFLRGDLYQRYYQTLDQNGGFYYYRWGDALIRTLAVKFILEPHEVYKFEDLGYEHAGICSLPCRRERTDFECTEWVDNTLVHCQPVIRQFATFSWASIAWTTVWAVKCLLVLSLAHFVYRLWLSDLDIPVFVRRRKD